MRGFLELARLWRSQWLPPERLAQLQARRLSSLVRVAHERVPFYRELLAASGVSPDEIRALSDLRRLPILTKGVLLAAPLASKLARGIDPSRCRTASTDGTTGFPMRLYYSPKDASLLGMTWVRALMASGVRTWDQRLQIVGPHNIPVRKQWYQHLRLWQTRGVSVFETPEAWVSAWRRSRATVLYGYASALKLLARHVLERGIGDVRPRRIFSVSEAVDDECRILVRRAFDCPLVDLYGAAEAGLIAWECRPCGQYHVAAETVIVELLRDGVPVAPGQSGSVVVTNLCSRAMPVIRYELGDVGTWASTGARCGRGLPSLAGIEGRTNAFVALPSGRVLPPSFFYALMRPGEGVRQWRVRQKATGEIAIEVVAEPGAAGETRARLLSRLGEAIGEPVPLELRFVPAIDLDPSGKNRTVASAMATGAPRWEGLAR
jgi:phenylacetate-CoA ligase